MHEYDVNVLAAKDGFALSVNLVGSTGSAPYLAFPSWAELRNFLQSRGASDELIRQLDRIGCSLKPGSVSKERMFLSDMLEQSLSPINPADERVLQTSNEPGHLLLGPTLSQ